MISEKSQKAIKELSEHVAVDETGNVQVGKALEVDGGIYAKGKDINIGESKWEFGTRCGIFYDDNENIAVGYWDNIGDVGGYVSFTKEGEVIISFWDIDAPDNTLQLNARDVYNAIKTKYFRHSLTLTCGATATYYIDYYSKNNLVVDSIQDLTTITGGHAFGCGSAQATYASNVWSIGGANLTAVSDVVTTLTD